MVHGLSRVTLETIVGAIPAGVVVIEKEKGRVCYVNDRAKQLYGVDPAGLQLRDHSTKLMKLLNLDGEVYPPEELPASKALLTGEAAKADLIVERPDGSRIVVSAYAQPIRDENGNVAAAVGIFEDITERKIFEAAVEEERVTLEGIIESTGAMIAYLDLNFNFIVVNSAYANGSGHSADELIGKNHFDIFPNKENQEIFAKVRDTGKPVIFLDKPFEFANQPHRGVTYWDWALTAAKDDTGQVHGLVLTLMETTERKKTEEALRESEERFRLVAEAANVLVYDIALPSYAVQIFRGEEILGYREGEIPRANDWWFSQIHPDDRAATQTKFDEAIKTGVDTLFEYRMKCKGGNYIVVHDMAKMVKDQQGKVALIVGGVRDVSERKRLQAKLEDYTKNLESLVEERTKQLKDKERLATIGQTAGMVGHDIRNPLQAITGDLYLLKEELKGVPAGLCRQSMQESVEAIEENVFYINKIVSDLQDYTRPLKPNFERIDIKEFINSTVLTANIPDTIETTVSADEGLFFNADIAYLRRVLTNLIVNAVQAMPDGGKLEIEACKRSGMALLSVKDDGVGIPEDVKPNLFKPLFTTKSKGQGLGLAVVKRLVEGLNGKITFESEHGKGTEFVIELPL